MYLSLIAERDWRVLGLSDAKGVPHIRKDLEHVCKGQRHLEERAWRLLLDHLPKHGLPLYNKQKCEQLDKELYELKIHPGKGAQVRVFVVSDAKDIIIVHAAKKAQRKIPREIIHARHLRDDYFDAKHADRIIRRVWERDSQ